MNNSESHITGDTITYCPYCASKLKLDDFESDDDGFNDWYDCTNSKCGQRIYWERN